MLKKSLFALLFAGASITTFGQCNKNIVYNSQKAEFTDSSGTVLHSKEGAITASVTKNDFVLMHDGDEEDALRGDVRNLVCNWTEANKTGKTTFESTLVEKNGETHNAHVTIEGDGNKISITATMPEENKILKIVAENFKETN